MLPAAKSVARHSQEPNAFAHPARETVKLPNKSRRNLEFFHMLSNRLKDASAH
jgi:hypothetical protein